jgi:hypothetical protein
MSVVARLVIAVLSASMVCLLPVISCMAMPEPEATARPFKVGSKIADLKFQLDGWEPSKIEVDGRPIERNVVIRSLSEDFDGKIELYHHSWVVPDDVKPSFVIELDYRDGILNHVDWGILPG